MVKGRKRLLEYLLIILEGPPEVGVALWVAQLPKLLFFLFFCQINGTFWLKKDSYQCRDTFEVWFHHHKWPTGSGCGAMSGAIDKIAVFLVFFPQNGTFWLKKRWLPMQEHLSSIILSLQIAYWKWAWRYEWRNCQNCCFLFFLAQKWHFWIKKGSYQCSITFELWFYHYK